MSAQQQREVYIGGNKFTANHAVVQNEASKNFGRAYWFVRDNEGKFIYFHWDTEKVQSPCPRKSLKRTLSMCLEKILDHKEGGEHKEENTIKRAKVDQSLIQQLLDVIDGIENPFTQSQVVVKKEVDK